MSVKVTTDVKTNGGYGSGPESQTETKRTCDIPKPRHVGPLGLSLHKAETPRARAKKRERAY